MLQTQWQAFEQDRAANLAELERRSADLAQRQEACDIKAQKVEELRQAAERANQDILEQRVIVEQVRAEIDRSVGTEEADALIQQVQAQLHEQWKHVRESLVHQRDELEETRQSLLRLRDEFHDEREVLTNWVSQREYQLKAAEEALTRERANSQLAENRWTAARDRWRDEKIEAENIIRGLLLQLEIMTSVPPDISYPSAPSQAVHIDEVSSLNLDEYGQLVNAA